MTCRATETRTSGEWICQAPDHPDRPTAHYFVKRQPATCPECLAGKHGNCDGDALDEQADEIVECRCYSAFHPGGQP